jgi:phosphate transport system substrate-binding protein
VGAKGNEGVAASLLQTKGSIGYVEAAYVRGVLQAAAIANRAGSFSLPDATNASQALATINLGDDLTGSDPNPSAGYPIVTFTWVLLYKNGNAAKLPSLQRTFGYALSDAAQQQALGLGYIPLAGNGAAAGPESPRRRRPVGRRRATSVGLLNLRQQGRIHDEVAHPVGMILIKGIGT